MKSILTLYTDITALYYDHIIIIHSRRAFYNRHQAMKNRTSHSTSISSRWRLSLHLIMTYLYHYHKYGVINVLKYLVSA